MAVTLEESKKLIDELNLTPMIERVMKEKRWTRRMAEVAAQYYRNFLFLSKKYGDQDFGPTEQIDEIWHAHILYTQEYHRDCEKIFGYYLHHQPERGEEKSAMSGGLAVLQQLHKQEFGFPIYESGYLLKDLFLFLTNLFKNRKYIMIKVN